MPRNRRQQERPHEHHRTFAAGRLRGVGALCRGLGDFGDSQPARRRDESTAEERVAFFDAAKGLAGAALSHLDRKPLSQLDEQEQRLMDLMLSFAHIAQAVEVQGDTEERHAKFRPEMQITRAPADAPPAA